MENPTRLLNRSFYLLWQGQTVSVLGNQVFMIALYFWLKHATGSATLLGLMEMAFGVPAILLGAVGGSVADRFSRRLILVAADLFAGLAVLQLSVVVFLFPQEKALIVGFIFGTVVVLGAVTSFFSPAIAAAVPDLVPREKLDTANSLVQVSLQCSTFVGQAIGGVLFRVIGAPALFLFNGLSYWFAAGSEYFTVIPQKELAPVQGLRAEITRFRNDIIEGLQYIWRRAGLRTMLVAATALNFLIVPIFLLLPFFVEDHLKLRSDWYGYLTAVYGLGLLGGSVAAGASGIRGRKRVPLMIAMMAVQSCAPVALAFVGSGSAALAVATVGGAAGGYFTVGITSVLQASTASEIRGRVFGLLGTLSASVTPLAAGVFGPLADLTGRNIPLIYGCAGAAMLLVTLLASLRPAFRRFLGREEDVKEQPATAAASAGGPR